MLINMLGAVQMTYKIKEYLFDIKKRFTTLELHSYGIAYLSLGFAIAFLIRIDVPWDRDWMEVVKAGASVLILFSIIMAIINYRYIKKWNQQNAAIKALYDSQAKTSDSIKFLDEHIQITRHFEKKLTYPIDHLHNSFGVFDANATFIFHKEDSERKTIYRSENKNYTMQFKKVDGRKIYNNIESYLNEVEYLATACKMEIFDKNTIYELKGGSFIYGFIVFKNFIYHNRYDKRHGYGPTLYENFELLAIEFGKKRGIEIEIPKESDYITPFDN